MRRDIESLFLAHIDAIRKGGKIYKVSFLSMLLSATGLTFTDLAELTPGNLCGQPYQRWAEKYLLDQYRIRYYAAWANSALNKSRLETKALAAEKADEIVQNALKSRDQRNKSLEAGRKKGAAENKRRSLEAKELARRLNNDLLKNPGTARWNLDKRAEHIIKNFKGTTSKNKKTKKEYAIITIKGWITKT